MGDIKRIRKKYDSPSHPWIRERIDSERILRRDYGLRNKKEIWKAETILKKIKNQIKRLPSMEPEHAAKQEKLLRARLVRMGVVKEDTPIRDVLGYGTESILDRRLQTILHKKGMARSPKQARQFIKHEHVVIGDTKVSSPGYLVQVDEENRISFHHNSGLASEMHPERAPTEKQQKERALREAAKALKEEEEDIELVDVSEEDEE